MKKIIFVCTGNTCRSPMAEFVFKDMVKRQGLEKDFLIESRATSSEALGCSVHRGTQKILTQKNIPFSDRQARKITQSDYDKYDLLIIMETANYPNLLRTIGEDAQGKVHRLLDFTDNPADIDDPWYTGDFESTYRDIHLGCDALLKYIKEKLI